MANLLENLNILLCIVLLIPVFVTFHQKRYVYSFFWLCIDGLWVLRLMMGYEG